MVMAITGIGLVGFVAMHLAGNLLLYVGPEAYSTYAHNLHAMGGGKLIYVMEVGLFLFFFMHIVTAFKLTFGNKSARPVAYGVHQSKMGKSGLAASSMMLVSGCILLGFIALHLIDFRFEARNVDYDAIRAAHPELWPYYRAKTLLMTPLSFIVYGVGTLVLAWHLFHGFQSMFHTLGLNHPKYTPLIKRLGLLFALAMGLGFFSFAAWGAMMSMKGGA
jgi:succinate dehydrogenase / fumarate reductase cytochrome b subunit